MITTDAPQRFAIHGWLDWKPPWWLLVAVFASLWTSILLAAIVRDYEPPAGWAGAVAGTPVAALLFGFAFWVARINADQHLVVRPGGLLLAIPFRKLIRYEEIEHVRRVNSSELSEEYGLIRGLANIINRRFMPARDEPPNIEIELRRPARLNLYPFRWFRQLVLTIDRPAAFLASLSDEVTVYGDRGGEDSSEEPAPYAFREKVILFGVLLFLVGATIYWIIFDG